MSTVQRTQAQLTRARTALADVLELLKYEQEACDRSTDFGRYRKVAFFILWQVLKEADRILARSELDGVGKPYCEADQKALDLVTQFRAIGPARIKDLVANARFLRANRRDEM